MAKKGQIMKINRLTALLIAAILVSGALLADQQAYISESNALRAAELLVPGTELQSFCEPCGDLEPADVAITSVEAVATGYESFWEVLVNGTGIDLAYTYIAYEGHWQNMAMILGLEVSDVSRFIGSGATTVEEDRSPCTRGHWHRACPDCRKTTWPHPGSKPARCPVLR